MWRQVSHRILQCPELVRYQELEAMLVSDNVTHAGSTQVLEVGVWFGMSQTELHLLLTLPVIKNESPNLGTCFQPLRSIVSIYNASHVSTRPSTRQVTDQPSIMCNGGEKLQQLAPIKDFLTFELWTAVAKLRAICHWWCIDVRELMKEFVLVVSVAQLVARRTNNLTVVSSIPAIGSVYHSWQVTAWS